MTVEVRAGTQANNVLSDAPAPPDEHTVELARHAVRAHCLVLWPEGPRCNYCHGIHPCVTYAWGAELLRNAGWTDDQIAALDQRRGPWS